MYRQFLFFFLFEIFLYLREIELKKLKLKPADELIMSLVWNTTVPLRDGG